jgi:hypothetical protein
MSDISQLPPQARYYAPQGPPTVDGQSFAAPTPAVPLHSLPDTQLTNAIPCDTQASALQPAAMPLAAPATDAFEFAALSQSPDEPRRLTTAIVYCEANFGAIDGKTANGLVRHSEKYEILSIIDSEKAGQDAGMVLDGVANANPVCRDLADALSRSETLPDFFIFGMAPSSGMLSTAERSLVLDAIGLGMNIVNGLHEFLNDDPEFVAASSASKVTILDARGISVTAVMKASLGSPEIARTMLRAGVSMIGDSRMENIEAMSRAGIRQVVAVAIGEGIERTGERTVPQFLFDQRRQPVDLFAKIHRFAVEVDPGHLQGGTQVTRSHYSCLRMAPSNSTLAAWIPVIDTPLGSTSVNSRSGLAGCACVTLTNPAAEADGSGWVRLCFRRQ